MSKDLLNNCFVEGRYYSHETLLSSGLSQKAIDLYTRQNGKGCAFFFCGFLSSEGSLFIILPKEQKAPSDTKELASFSGILFMTLRRYAAENNLDEEELSLLGKQGGRRENYVAAALELLNDYNLSGLLQRDTVQISAAGKGKIDWVRTVNSQLPVFSEDFPFYFDTTNKNRSRDTNSIIIQLHRYAIQQCRKTYGWILSPDFEPEKIAIPTMPCSLSRALYVLSNELHLSFRERDIRVLNLLIAYFSNESSSADEMKCCAYGTTKFHHIWEIICRDLFKHDNTKMQLVPRPQWVRCFDGQLSTEKTRQLPDILYVDNEICYVLDAKYYTHSSALPGWGDMVKQFYYADTIQSEEFSTIRNAMIFPGTHNETLAYIGYAEIADKAEQIQAFSLNLFQALSSYSSFSRNGYREELKTIWP